MAKFKKINYGNKILLSNCRIPNATVLQGDVFYFETEWEILKRLPLGQKICYYFTNGIDTTFNFLDTEKPFSKNILYSQLLVGEKFKDTISIPIPYDLPEGDYEINAFLYPLRGFESSDGINSSVWESQKVIGKFEVKWQKDLSEKFKKYRTSDKSKFFDALISFWDQNGSLEYNPNIYMWADFAFTTNQRGKGVIEILEQYTDFEGKSFLDVGCAYCGFLVAAKLAGAHYVEGIDINEVLISLGKKNLEDFSIDAFVHIGDILDEEYKKKNKSKFDIITCNDVIEHVLDPIVAIKNISEILVQKGVVMFEIPNMNHPNFVIKDGHFSVFAITLLEREDALLYFEDTYHGDYSSVGFYKNLEYYRKIFKKYGLKFIIDKSTLLWVNRKEIEEKVSFLRENYDSLMTGVGNKYKKLVGDKVQEYIKTFDYNSKHMSEEDFLLYYGPAFWTVIGKK